MALIEMGDEAEDLSLVDEAKEEIESIKNEIASMKLSTLLTGEYDKNNAILTFHAGAGGTEAQDWAEMLYRMYTRWAERHGFKVTTLDYLDGDEAGIKSASIMVEGENAYGYLEERERASTGWCASPPLTPRAAARPPSARWRSCPRWSWTTTVEIRPGGHQDGSLPRQRRRRPEGQQDLLRRAADPHPHRHHRVLPGGAQPVPEPGSGHEDAAWPSWWRSKSAENLEKISDIKGEQKEISWGSQIRSYVFMPYTMVKDHRTGYETGNVNAVMDGDLDGFINAYLTAQSQGTLGENIE